MDEKNCDKKALFLLRDVLKYRTKILPGRNGPVRCNRETMMEVWSWCIQKLKSVKVKLHLSLKIDIRIG